MNDEMILRTLKNDPERGMCLLMEQYTGLVWKVISLHLNLPEDIRECTNDTFAEFYFHLDRFDPEKASLAVWLTAVARNLAISRYRKENSRRVSSLPPMLPYEDQQLDLAEIQADLERALASLKPDELQIIRMKYYNGMSVREIADSLSLPYEAVKKRHQRTISKLRRILLVLLMILLLGLLSACTYEILVYYEIIPDFITEFWYNEGSDTPEDTVGSAEPLNIETDIPASFSSAPALSDTDVSPPDSEQNDSDNIQSTQEDSAVQDSVLSSFSVVPGYGINMTPEIPAYVLYETVYVENEALELTLLDASWLNGSLQIRLTAETKDPSVSIYDYYPQEPYSLSYNDRIWEKSEEINQLIERRKETKVFSEEYGEITMFSSIVYGMTSEVAFSVSELPKTEDGALELTLTTPYGIPVTFTLVSAIEKSLDSYAYQIGEHGGLLAVPRLEDGSLIVGIYPIDTEDDDYRFYPELIHGIISYDDMPTADTCLTVTKDDGTVLTGTYFKKDMIRTDMDTFYEWDFGSAGPGTYTLHVPYLYQFTTGSEDFAISLNLRDLTWEDREYPVTGGSIRITDCTLLDLGEGEPIDGTPYHKNSGYTYWKVSLQYTSEDPNRPITNFVFRHNCIPLSYILDGGDPDSYDYSASWLIGIGCFLYNLDTDAGTLDLLLPINESLYDPAYCLLTLTDDSLVAFPPAVNYRWEQSFDLTFTVE